MKTILFVAGLAAVGLLIGCDTIPPGAERGPHGTMAYDVLIEATDPGAQIEANGAVVGTTPLHLKIFGDPDGTFHDFGSYEYVIRALPLVTNQFPQIRIFQTGHLLTPEDRIPPRISFDMNQPAAAPVPYAAPGPYYYPPPYYYYPPPYYYGPRIYVGPHYYRHY